MDVWNACTNPADIMVWNAASPDWHMEAKDGSFGFDFAGEYTRVVKGELIEYQFGERTARVDFAENVDGVQVTVSFDPETLHSEEQQREGWQSILDHFARYVSRQK